MMAVPATSDAAGGSSVACAGATTTATTGGTAPTTTTTNTTPGSPPPTGGSCWEDIQPYPFGSKGEPVNTSECAHGANPGSPQVAECYLTVTSMAFRAWNRGLAATEAQRGEPTTFPVWIFNGAAWYPAPKLPSAGGTQVCTGEKVLWAGKLDYWLVGGSPTNGKWADLCRFDGSRLEWDPIEVPEATLKRVTPAPTKETPHPFPDGGTITAGACFAWNNCWFFGTYGTVLHYSEVEEGEPPKPVLELRDASPGSSQGLLWGEYTAAVARVGRGSETFGVAVGATSERSTRPPLVTKAPGAPPTQFYGSKGEAFSPLAFAPVTAPPFTTPQSGDPYRTDLVAVDFDSAGSGWVAGNPAGLRVEPKPLPHDPSPPEARPFSPTTAPQPSPLLPVSSSGGTSACEGPPGERFSYTAEPAATAATGAFLWSSIAVFPLSGEALAGGHMRSATAGPGPNENTSASEPVIVRAGCNGSTTATRFRIPDPTHPGATAPASRESAVTALAANAGNDAWASTGEGGLPGFIEPPHLYRFSNGQQPEAPEGDDLEERPGPPEEKPRIVFELPPEEPPRAAPPTVTQTTQSVRLPSAVYDVKAKLHTARRHGHLILSLYLTFRLRRPFTVGAQALRGKRVVSVARPRYFAGKTGLLILTLNRKRWPTKVHFIT
jgi:hypothetical protein